MQGKKELTPKMMYLVQKLTKNKAYAQKMSRLRSSTVEPVLGTLINFLNMKRVNTRGIDLANKHVLMSALTYNLKKYLKFVSKKVLSNAIAMPIEVKSDFYTCISAFLLIFRSFQPILLENENHKQKNITR